MACPNVLLKWRKEYIKVIQPGPKAALLPPRAQMRVEPGSSDPSSPLTPPHPHLSRWIWSTGLVGKTGAQNPGKNRQEPQSLRYHTGRQALAKNKQKITAPCSILTSTRSTKMRSVGSQNGRAPGSATWPGRASSKCSINMNFISSFSSLRWNQTHILIPFRTYFSRIFQSSKLEEKYRVSGLQDEDGERVCYTTMWIDWTQLNCTLKNGQFLAKMVNFVTWFYQNVLKVKLKGDLEVY